MLSIDANEAEFHVSVTQTSGTDHKTSQDRVLQMLEGPWQDQDHENMVKIKSRLVDYNTGQQSNPI